MDYDGLLQLAKLRRSVRSFKPDPLPDEYITKIIEVARWAPSGFNLQPWEFIVVKERKLKDAVVRLISEGRNSNMAMEATRERWQGTVWKQQGNELEDFSTAPVFIILAGDTRTKQGLPMILRYDHRRGDSTLNSGLASAFLYMHLAATALGLGSQWVSQVGEPKTACLLQKLLRIPRHMELYDMLAVGYSAQQPRQKLLRSDDKMVHYDYCGEKDFRTDREVKDFIRRIRTWTIAMHHRQTAR